METNFFFDYVNAMSLAEMQQKKENSSPKKLGSYIKQTMYVWCNTSSEALGSQADAST